MRKIIETRIAELQDQHTALRKLPTPENAIAGMSDELRETEMRLVEANYLLSLIQSEVDNGGWIDGIALLRSMQKRVDDIDTAIAKVTKEIINEPTLKGTGMEQLAIRDLAELRGEKTGLHWVIRAMDFKESSPGKAPQSGGAMEVLRGLNEVWDFYANTDRKRDDTVYAGYVCKEKELKDRARSLVSGQLLSSPTSENKEK